MQENTMQALYQTMHSAIQERLDDLLSRMTIPEKVGQLMQVDGRLNLDEMIGRKLVGSLLHINGAEADMARSKAARTRLGIPLLIADDGIHGHSFWAGATIFPTQLAMACSWNPALLEKAARVTAREMRATGVSWTFSPVLCIARDLRWGRVGETFGEDPYLIEQLGLAMIRGYQGKGLSDVESVLATAKHFAGYSETQGGRDASEADLSLRKLSSWFLPPFEAAARHGCMAFMTGYQSIDGLPSTANRWLLSEKLRDDWGFPGILVTDWDNVGRLVWKQQVCTDLAEAAALAIKSGNDMIMSTPGFFEAAQEAIVRGILTEADLDIPVRRVLDLKFRMGLFENPQASDQARIQHVIACKEHKQVNLELARASLVLLRNNPLDNKPCLPLARKSRLQIAVIGPNADNPIAQLGDWSLGSGQMAITKTACHPRSSVVTVLDGFRQHEPSDCVVSYAPGCSLGDAGDVDLPEALRLAGKADYVLLVLGDTIAYTGETKSTATLELMGGQKHLAEAIMQTGKPVIVILINSKPLVLPDCLLGFNPHTSEATPRGGALAIIEAFNPGMQGGTAIAEVVFGIVNPSGKLPVSIPYHVGQQPLYYNQIRGQNGTRYADLPQEPAFAFGFGLSYTSFAYEALQVWLAIGSAQDELIVAEVSVRNTGSVEGSETVQLYVEDVVTSLTWAQKELKAFQELRLMPGETRLIRFELPVDRCTIVNQQLERVVEPGEFRIHVGSSSRVQDLLHQSVVIGSMRPSSLGRQPGV